MLTSFFSPSEVQCRDSAPCRQRLAEASTQTEMWSVEAQAANLVNNTWVVLKLSDKSLITGYLQYFAITKSVAVNSILHISFHAFARALWDRFPEMRLLGQRINAEYCQILLQGDLPLCIPNSNAWERLFSLNFISR